MSVIIHFLETRQGNLLMSMLGAILSAIGLFATIYGIRVSRISGKETQEEHRQREIATASAGRAIDIAYSTLIVVKPYFEGDEKKKEAINDRLEELKPLKQEFVDRLRTTERVAQAGDS